jgi:hypothetical protein
LAREYLNTRKDQFLNTQKPWMKSTTICEECPVLGSNNVKTTFFGTVVCV